MTFSRVPLRTGEGLARYRTFCCYGAPRTGKTRFLGTFPNALVIADATERGWITLETMPDDEFYHPGKAPVVLAVSNRDEMLATLDVASRAVLAGYIDTIGVDSLTFYADSWFQTEIAKLIKANAGNSANIDTRAIYGALASHLNVIRQQVHRLPCNVVWTALEAAPEQKRLGGIMVSGKSRERFPAGCDHICRHVAIEVAATDEHEAYMAYMMYTKATEGFVGGGRDSGALADLIYYPKFRDIADALGLPEFEPKIVPPELLAPPAPVAAAPAAKPVASRPTASAAPRPRRAAAPARR